MFGATPLFSLPLWFDRWKAEGKSDAFGVGFSGNQSRYLSFHLLFVLLWEEKAFYSKDLGSSKMESCKLNQHEEWTAGKRFAPTLTELTKEVVDKRSKVEI